MYSITKITRGRWKKDSWGESNYHQRARQVEKIWRINLPVFAIHLFPEISG